MKPALDGQPPTGMLRDGSAARTESIRWAAFVEINVNQFHDTPLAVPGLFVRHLGFEDIDLLQALLEKSSDYSLLVTGLPPAASAAYSLLTDLPEGKTPSDKLVVGFFAEKQNLIGVLDIIRDYPSQGVWWLRLLILDPEYRGQGLGQRIYSAFEKWVTQCGGHRVCLGVIEQNQDAYRFWQKVGFEPLERKPAKHFGNAEHVVTTMARKLTD